MAKIKTFCKWTEKDIQKRVNLLADLVDEPRYVCKKCARVANSKKLVCKPMEMPIPALSFR